MKKIISSISLMVAIQSVALGGQLTQLANEFVKAAGSGDSAALAKTYVDAPSKVGVLKEFAEAVKEIQEGKITAVDRELVIGDLGVTLLRIEMDGSKEFEPLICVRTNGTWKVYPSGSEDDLNELHKTRTPDEQIHLKLFEEWADLVEEQLEEPKPGDDSKKDKE